MAGIKGADYSGFLVGEVKVIDVESRKIGVYLHQLMANISSASSEPTSIPTVTNTDITKNVDKSTYNETVEIVNYIWVRTLNIEYKMPEIGSKVLVFFVDEDPKKGFWQPFFFNERSYTYIDEEKYSKLFKINEYDVKEEDEVSFEVGNGLAKTIKSDPENKKHTVTFNIDNLYSGNTPPKDLSNGQLWLDSNTGSIYVYGDNGFTKLTQSDSGVANRIFRRTDTKDGNVVKMPEIFFSKTSHNLRLTVNNQYLIEDRDYSINESTRQIILKNNILAGSTVDFEFFEKDITGITTKYSEIPVSSIDDTSKVDITKYVTPATFDLDLYINNRRVFSEDYSFDFRQQTLQLPEDLNKEDIKTIYIESYEDNDVKYSLNKINLTLNKKDFNFDNITNIYTIPEDKYKHFRYNIVNILLHDNIALNQRHFDYNDNGEIVFRKANIDWHLLPDEIKTTLIIYRYGGKGGTLTGVDDGNGAGDHTHEAVEIYFDNKYSELSAKDVQKAIVELEYNMSDTQVDIQNIVGQLGENTITVNMDKYTEFTKVKVYWYGDLLDEDVHYSFDYDTGIVTFGWTFTEPDEFTVEFYNKATKNTLLDPRNTVFTDEKIIPEGTKHFQITEPNYDETALVDVFLEGDMLVENRHYTIDRTNAIVTFGYDMDEDTSVSARIITTLKASNYRRVDWVPNSTDITYDSTISGLNATNNKEAIDEIAEHIITIKESLGEETEGINNPLDKIRDDISTNINDINLNKGSITTLENDLSNTETTLSDMINTVETELNDKTNNVETNLTNNIDTVESTLNARIDTVEVNINDTNTTLTNNITTVENTLNVRVDTVETNLTNSENTLNVRVDTVETNLTNVETTLTNNITTVETNVTSNKTEIDQISSVVNNNVKTISNDDDTKRVKIKFNDESNTLDFVFEIDGDV